METKQSARMAADFDPEDRNSWYFGELSREETNNILFRERDSGVFLVRDSSSIQGDFVLCVKEDSKISHYIINKVASGCKTEFRIGDQQFANLPGLLSFYKTHYLDTTPLIRPAPREILKVITRFDFPGRDPEDLPFKKGEVLVIVKKDEEQWWTARNSKGEEGQIPMNYVLKYDPQVHQPVEPPRPANENHSFTETPKYSVPDTVGRQRTMPAYAKVIQARIPNAYDKTALKLEVGDIVKVTKTNVNGTWEGELNGRTGHFPFRYVEFIDSDEEGAHS